MLEVLCKTDGHYYDFSTKTGIYYLAAYTKVNSETAEEILGTLAEMGKIDRELWSERRVIWCQTLVDNLKTLYAKRAVSAPEKPSLNEFSERKTDENGISETEKHEKAEKIENQEPEKPPEEKPKKKRKTKAEREAESRESKKQYAEFVFLKEEEHKKLLDQYGEAKTARMIEVLDNYKGSKGATYASDYRAILNWVVERVEEEFKRNGGNYGGNNFRSAGSGGQTGTGGGFSPSRGFRQDKPPDTTIRSETPGNEVETGPTGNGELQVLRSDLGAGGNGAG